MTVEQYNKDIAILEAEFKAAKNKVMREYAFTNNTIIRGDIIGDHIGKIEVSSISWEAPCSFYGTKVPMCIYEGYVLNKDGSRRKSNETRSIFQKYLEKN